ncbi:MAG: hypothetical protein FJX72_12585 [Armatimonadetes bacterium]|nr:hypothetical protein [Armatimonadota bacterium]
MTDFPRTTVGGVSMPRMIIGSNWFLGYSHCTPAKDRLIHASFEDYRKLADMLEVFLDAGVDAVMGFGRNELLQAGVKEAEQRTRRKCIIVSTPSLPHDRSTAKSGFDMDAIRELLDAEAACGATFCMPHTSTTDDMVDNCAREVRHMAAVFAEMRLRGLVPGLSTHLPQTIVFADETGLDAETYISIYNAMGFLMPLEVDWTQRIIQNARKPVITIKPMAAGQVRPFQAFHFVWNTLRPQDMVTVGCMTPDEAKEVVELSMSILERRAADVQLQETRSKATVKTTAA